MAGLMQYLVGFMTVILSITFLQFSFCEGGWGARVADYFQRLVSNLSISSFVRTNYTGVGTKGHSIS